MPSSNSNPTYSTTGPFGFDEVFEQDALRDIYEFWLRDNGVKYAKETMAAWSMRLKEHGFYYDIYIREREPGIYNIPTDLIEFRMPVDAVSGRVLTTISLVNVREELFQLIGVKDQQSYINYILATYTYEEDTNHPAISYVLPTFKELYSVPTTEGNTVATTEPAGNGQYRTHARYADEDEDEDEFSVIEPADITERDVDAAKLRLDINNCRWGIIRENDAKNTALVMREYSPDFKKGETIKTGTLYHRPLYYSDMYSGYWINRDSELYRLIKANNHPNPAGSWMVCYKPRDEPKPTTPAKTEVSAGQKLRSDLKNWFIAGTMKYRNSVLICPNDDSVFAMRNRNGDMVYDTVIDTGYLYHRPLYYSPKHGGYWISNDSEFVRLIRLRLSVIG